MRRAEPFTGVSASVVAMDASSGMISCSPDTMNMEVMFDVCASSETRLPALWSQIN